MINHQEAKGYPPERQFYSPSYDDPQNSSQLRDLRTTIFWNPNVISNPEGKAKYRFFQGSKSG